MNRRGLLSTIACAPFLSGVIARLAQAQESPGVLPSEQAIVNPHTWVENFPTGTNTLVASQTEALNKIRVYLLEHKKDVAVLIGMVSDLQIRGNCYVNYETGYFSLRQNQQGCTVLSGNRACQEALSLSRGIAVRNWLLANGIEQPRVRILNFNAVGLKTGGNYPNQAVAAWIITFDHVEEGGIMFIPGEPCQPPPEQQPRGRSRVIHYNVDP